MTIFPLWAMVVLAALGLFMCCGGISLVYDYQLLDNGIALALFRLIPIWTIPYSEISDVRKITWKNWTRHDISCFALKLGNRLTTTFVLLRRKKGLIKEIHLSPRNVDQFVSTVLSRARLGASG